MRPLCCLAPGVRKNQGLNTRKTHDIRLIPTAYRTKSRNHNEIGSVPLACTCANIIYIRRPRVKQGEPVRKDVPTASQQQQHSRWDVRAPKPCCFPALSSFTAMVVWHLGGVRFLTAAAAAAAGQQQQQVSLGFLLILEWFC